MSSDRQRVFKRLETDAEFRFRINASDFAYVSEHSSGTWLDDLAWNNYRLQRRIIEDER
jgi:hypothetical protein